MVVDARCSIGEGLRYGLAPEALLAHMDAAGVDVAFVSAADRHLAVANREGDDLVIEACAAHPDRFVGFAGVNPWYGAAAVAELRRAAGAGLRGLVLHPPLQGFMLVDGVADPLLAAASDLRLAVYVHTGTPVSALPLQLAALARRFPDVPFVMGHMGHSDFWIDVLPAARSADNVYVETSYKQPLAIEDAVAQLGPERVLFGSDLPLGDLEAELAKFDACTLDARERALVRGDSARALAGLEVPA